MVRGRRPSLNKGFRKYGEEGRFYAIGLGTVRRKSMLTYKNISKIIGTSLESVYRMEKLLMKMSALQAIRLCENLGIDIDDLYADKENFKAAHIPVEKNKKLDIIKLVRKSNQANQEVDGEDSEDE